MKEVTLAKCNGRWGFSCTAVPRGYLTPLLMPPPPLEEVIFHVTPRRIWTHPKIWFWVGSQSFWLFLGRSVPLFQKPHFFSENQPVGAGVGHSGIRKEICQKRKKRPNFFPSTRLFQWFLPTSAGVLAKNQSVTLKKPPRVGQ